MGVILAAGLVMRLLYHLAYRPWWSGDTVWFTSRLWEWTHGYYPDGWRQPVYSLFLGLADLVAGSRVAYGAISVEAASVAVVLQSALGLLAVVLICDTMRTLGVRERLAFGGALFFALVGGFSHFEMLLLSQSLAVFWLVLSCWLFVRTMKRLQRGDPVIFSAILTGLGSCVAVLVRAEMLVFFGALLGCMTLVFALIAFRGRSQAAAGPTKRRSPSKAVRRTFAQSAGTALWAAPMAAAPGTLLWMYLIYLGTGQFKLTTIMGYNFNQTVYNLYDRVGQEDRVLGQIMVKYYRQFNHDGQVRRDYLWSALPEIDAHRQEMPIHQRERPVRDPDPYGISQNIANNLDLGDYMGEVSLKLAKDNPRDYLGNVAGSFVHDTFNFAYPQTAPRAEITAASDPRSVDGRDVVRYPALWRIAVWINRVQAPLLCGLYVCTLALALGGPIWLLWGPRSGTALMDGAVLAMVLSTVATFLSFCVTMAYRSEYGPPFLGVMLIAFVYTLDRILGWREAKRSQSLVVAALSAQAGRHAAKPVARAKGRANEASRV
jgi:hypothetical protein